MKKIINYHVLDRNAGDMNASPLKYFDFPVITEERNLAGAEPVEDSNVILGGGGLLFQRFEKDIREILKSKGAKKVIWGAGLQIYGPRSSEEKFEPPSYVRDFDLVGIRDHGLGYEWVPCASCMHSVFDKKIDIKHEFVVFEHKKFSLPIEGYPKMNNCETNDMEKIVKFLGSGETVLTSSYHGMYWAMLMGRKVLAFPFTSKFLTFKYRPAVYPEIKWRPKAKWIELLKPFGRIVNYHRFIPYGKMRYICCVDKWQDAVKICRVYKDLLNECRAANKVFYEKVLRIFQ